jgi:hypothetical protein
MEAAAAKAPGDLGKRKWRAESDPGFFVRASATRRRHERCRIAACPRQSAASLLRLGFANSKNSARSPWYLAPRRLACDPLMMAFPDESTTRHSHLDRPRPLTITTSSIRSIGVTSSDKVQSQRRADRTWRRAQSRPRASLSARSRRADGLRFGPPASAVRIVCVSQENADTKKSKQARDYLSHCCRPPRLAMPGTALFKNSR